MTRIGVKLRRIRNLYVLIVYVPGSRTAILTRRVARRPWMPIARGEELRARRRIVRVTSVQTHIERRGDDVENVTEVYTRAVVKKRVRRPAIPPANVVRMPTGDGSVVAEFIRYHVLVRVFNGDPDAWLAHLMRDGDPAGGDVRFARRVRARLRKNPALIISIRRMVDATPFWRAAEA